MPDSGDPGGRWRYLNVLSPTRHRMNIYDLYRDFWDWAFENPEKIKPNHIALFSFAIEHCNRLGWKKKFGLPTAMTMDAVGIKSYSVYKKALFELVEFGFVEMVQVSKNQHSSNIVALKENYKAHYKALDKAMSKHLSKHTSKQVQSTFESTLQRTVSIDKQYYNSTNLQSYGEVENSEEFSDCDPEEKLTEEDVHPAERMAAFRAESSSPKPTEEEKEKVAPKRKNMQLEILEQCELPFGSENFMKHWLLFLDYKQKQRKPYTSTVGMQAALRKCSGYPEAVVIQSLLDSMSNNWQGFFPEKTTTHGKHTGNQTGKPSIAEQFQRIRAKIAAGNSHGEPG